MRHGRRGEDQRLLPRGRVDQVRARRSLKEEEAAPQPRLARHLLERLVVGRDLVQGQDVQEEGHAVLRVLVGLGNQERARHDHLREHEGEVLARARVVQAETLIQQRGRLCQEALVVGARHHHVDVVIPGDEPTVADRADRGAAVDRIGHSDAAAHPVQLGQDQRQELLDLAQVVLGCHHQSSEYDKAGERTCAHPPLSHAWELVTFSVRLGSRSPQLEVAARTVPTRITTQHATWVAVGTVPCRTRAKMIAHAE